jgi:ADP-ribosylglycohydrolase
MIGAIAGDIIGSVYERHYITTTEFPLFDPRCRFTDDTVLTVAVADAILTGSDYGAKLKEWYRLYSGRDFGGGFKKWAAHDSLEPRSSMGNGSAMRVSPIGFAFDTLETVLEEARRSAEASHNHPEGIKGAQAVAAAGFLARKKASKTEIKAYIVDVFGYDLDQGLEYIRGTTAQTSPAPARSPRRSQPSCSLRTMRMRFERPSRWAAMRIPSPAWLVVSLRPATATCRSASPKQLHACSTTAYRMWCGSSN